MCHEEGRERWVRLFRPEGLRIILTGDRVIISARQLPHVQLVMLNGARRLNRACSTAMPTLPSTRVRVSFGAYPTFADEAKGRRPGCDAEAQRGMAAVRNRRNLAIGVGIKKDRNLSGS